jgi:hypothetical protein
LSTPGIRADAPTEEFDQDRLDRANLAPALGRVIAAYERPETLDASLYSEWGLRKTSVLNLALKSISQTKPPPPSFTSIGGEGIGLNRVRDSSDLRYA